MHENSIVTIDVEEWRPIDGWPDYEVSNLGRVRSVRKYAKGARSSMLGMGIHKRSNGTYMAAIGVGGRSLRLGTFSDLNEALAARVAAESAKPPRIMKPWEHAAGGYPAVTLYGDDRRWKVCVHHLVCTAFHGPKPPDKDEVAHGDGNPKNNVASNLRWATYKENAGDMKLHGTNLVGEQRHNAKLTNQDVREIAELIVSGARDADIAAKLGTSKGSVASIRGGQSWSWLTGFKAGDHYHGKARGEASGRAKLGAHQVLEILDAISHGWSYRQLAAEYGITHAYISNIKSGRVWKHLERRPPGCFRAHFVIRAFRALSNNRTLEAI